ncbi:hypothetical protein GGS21DRAFT_465802 [Xylaria nigripes]|nr:hypothetical protein GGS21DRAFT_465802 [Xylaria nigripes]
MEASKSRRMQTIDALLDGYGSLSVAKILEPLAPQFRYQTMPQSLGLPVLDRDAFAKHAEWIFGIFEDFKMVPMTIIDDAHAGIVAINARMLGTLKCGQRPWANECVLIVRLTDDDLGVLDLQEFVDSAKAMELARIHAQGDLNSADDNASNILDGSFCGWGLLDSDLWIHIGAAVILALSLRQVFR